MTKRAELVRCVRCGAAVHRRAEACQSCGLAKFNPGSYIECANCGELTLRKDREGCECAHCGDTDFMPYACAFCRAGKHISEGRYLRGPGGTESFVCEACWQEHFPPPRAVVKCEACGWKGDIARPNDSPRLSIGGPDDWSWVRATCNPCPSCGNPELAQGVRLPRVKVCAECYDPISWILPSRSLRERTYSGHERVEHYYHPKCLKKRKALGHKRYRK